jgi:hypothetical protein
MCLTCIGPQVQSPAPKIITIKIKCTFWLLHSYIKWLRRPYNLLELFKGTKEYSIYFKEGGGLTNGLRKCGIYTQWNFMQP